MGATHRLTRPKGIPKTAVPVYQLAPSDEPDAYAWVARRLEARGWTAVEEDYRIGPASAGGWIMVELWAIAPGKEN